MNIQEIREKYPEYNHASDQQLADALHKKYYSHVPVETFYEKIGFQNQSNNLNEVRNNPERDSWESSPRDTLGGLANKGIEAGAKGLNYIANIPNEIQTGIQGHQENPIRQIGNYGYGALNTAKSIANLPSEALSFALRNGMQFERAIEPLVRHLRIPEETGLGKAIFGETKESDKLARDIGSLGLGKSLSSLSKFLRPAESKPAMAAERLLEGAETLESKAAQSKYKAETSAQARKDFLESIGEKHAATTPNQFQRKITSKENALADLEEAKNIPFEKTKNLLPDESHRDIVTNADKAIEAVHKGISPYLYAGETHDVHLANFLNKFVDKEKKSIQKETYEPLKKNLQDKHVVIPHSDDLLQIDSELKNILGNDIFDIKQFEKAKKLIFKPTEGKTYIPANDFLDINRATKDAANKAAREGYKPGAGAEHQLFWQKQNEKLQALADRQTKILEDNIGTENADLLKKGNNLWKDKIIPFYNEAVYKSSQKHGKINSANIMHDIRGSSKGQQAIREAFKSSPEATKMLLGQRYAENPKGLLTLNKNEMQYLENLPELKERTKRLHQVHQNRVIAEKVHGEREGEKLRVERAHKDIVESQVKREKAVREGAKLESEIKELDSAMTELRRLNREEKTSKAQHENNLKLIAEKDSIKAAKKEKLKKLRSAATWLAAGMGIKGIF